MRLLGIFTNPLVLLLMALGVLSFLTGDLRATVVIFVMVVLGVVLRFFQEMRPITRPRSSKRWSAIRRRWCEMARKPKYR